MIKTETIPEGYCSTEAGILPVDWQVKRLSEIATELTERAGQDSYETVSISAGIGFVNQAEKFGKELSGKQYEKYIVLHRGDFSYNKGNSKTYPQGCIYRLNDRETAAVPNVFESFRIEDQDADYYEQLFLSGFLNKQLYSKINRGVRDDGLLNLTGEDFYSCMVPVPPIAEQKKIAKILTQWDAIIQIHSDLVEQLETIKRVYCDLLFPQKQNESPEIHFGKFSEPWMEHKLYDITQKIGSGKTPSGGRSTYVDMGIPLLRSQNIANNQVNMDDVVYIDSETDEEMKNSRVQFGDVLLNITGASIGRSAVYRKETAANVNQHVCIIRPKKEFVPEFIQLLLSSSEGQRKITLNQAGGGRRGLNFYQIGEMTFRFPSKSEQEYISKFFESVERYHILYNEKLHELREQKTGLMKLLLTGSVRVKP